MTSRDKTPEPKSSPEMAPTTHKAPRHNDNLPVREKSVATAQIQIDAATTTTPHAPGDRPSLDSPFSSTALFDHGRVDPHVSLTPARRRPGFAANMARAQMSTSVLRNAFNRDDPPVPARDSAEEEASVDPNDRQAGGPTMARDYDDHDEEYDVDEYVGDIEDDDEEFVKMKEVAERDAEIRALEPALETREQEYSPGRPEEVDESMGGSITLGGHNEHASDPAPESDPGGATGVDDGTVRGSAPLANKGTREVAAEPASRGNGIGSPGIPIIVVEPTTDKRVKQHETIEAVSEVSYPVATPDWVRRIFDPPTGNEAASRQVGGRAGSAGKDPPADPITPPAQTSRAITATVRRCIDAYCARPASAEDGDVDLNGSESKETEQVNKAKKVDEYSYGEEGEEESDTDSDSDFSSEDDEKGEGEYDAALIKHAMADLKRQG
ncbi:hypothetical protein E4T39_06249 [Aureobasidium subglaciale]|nr:hypothetical protein E4T39_06249 [Aureobasidium subglaciale]